MRQIVLSFAFLGVAATAMAQVQSRPTDPPLVTAASESWYVLREPITIAGDVYYPAGAVTFFNGNTMVRSGHYNGVPVYSDTTLEPFSVFFVPVTRGMMQPYERPRGGALAGTTGSRTPSVPVRVVPEARAAGGAVGMAAVAPTAPPQPAGAIGVFTPERAAQEPAAVGTAGTFAAKQSAPPLVSLMRPQSNDGLWIRFRGGKWVSRGAAVPLEAAGLTQIGEHAGFPVYAQAGQAGDVIYLPTRAGLVAPYRRQ